jgi:hypothetical protein
MDADKRAQMTQMDTDFVWYRGERLAPPIRMAVYNRNPVHHDLKNNCVICVHLRPVRIGAIGAYAKRGLRGRAGVSVAGGRDGRLRYHSITMLSGARMIEMNCEVDRTSKTRPRSSPR